MARTPKRVGIFQCPVCRREFARALNQVRTDQPLCSNTCRAKHRGVPLWQSRKATEASRVARAERMKAALAYYFGKLSERELDIFRKGYTVGYEKGRRRTRREERQGGMTGQEYLVMWNGA